MTEKRIALAWGSLRKSYPSDDLRRMLVSKTDMLRISSSLCNKQSFAMSRLNLRAREKLMFPLEMIEQ